MLPLICKMMYVFPLSWKGAGTSNVPLSYAVTLGEFTKYKNYVSQSNANTPQLQGS